MYVYTYIYRCIPPDAPIQSITDSITESITSSITSNTTTPPSIGVIEGVRHVKVGASHVTTYQHIDSRCNNFHAHKHTLKCDHLSEYVT